MAPFTNGDVFFTSSLEYTLGRWFHPPSMFVEWALVFLISTASFTPLAVQSVSLVQNFTPSQSMGLFSFVAWSMMANGCTTDTKSFFLAQVYFFSYIVLTSLLCSFSLTPYLLPVSPIHTHGQSLQWTCYTTPTFSCSVHMSFRSTIILFSVMWDFINFATPCRWKTRFRASDTTLT